MSSINPGDMVTIRGSFINAVTSAPADPTTVTLRVRLRTSTATEAVYTYALGQVVKDTTGNYHVNYTVPTIAPARRRTIEYQWEGAGAVVAVEQKAFVVTDAYG